MISWLEYGQRARDLAVRLTVLGDGHSARLWVRMATLVEDWPVDHLTEPCSKVAEVVLINDELLAEAKETADGKSKIQNPKSENVVWVLVAVVAELSCENDFLKRRQTELQGECNRQLREIRNLRAQTSNSKLQTPKEDAGPIVHGMRILFGDGTDGGGFTERS